MKRRSSTVASELTAAKRLKDLEKENSRLKRLLADAELDSGVSGGRMGNFGAFSLRQRTVQHVRGALGCETGFEEGLRRR